MTAAQHIMSDESLTAFGIDRETYDLCESMLAAASSANRPALELAVKAIQAKRGGMSTLPAYVKTRIVRAKNIYTLAAQNDPRDTGIPQPLTKARGRRMNDSDTDLAD